MNIRRRGGEGITLERTHSFPLPKALFEYEVVSPFPFPTRPCVPSQSLSSSQVKDALLLAIAEEYVEGVEILLHHEEQHHTPGTPHSWEAVDSVSASYTPDVTPLILAAHKNNYEILKILLDRGAKVPQPHNLRCRQE